MKKQQVLKIRGREFTRDLETEKLDGDGSEKTDPVPLATTLGITPTPTLDDRVRAILRQDFFKKNPDYGLDSEDPDDFGDGDQDPMYVFERKHERLMEMKREMENAKKEYEEAQKEKQKYMRERRKLKRRGVPESGATKMADDSIEGDDGLQQSFPDDSGDRRENDSKPSKKRGTKGE